MERREASILGFSVLQGKNFLKEKKKKAIWFDARYITKADIMSPRDYFHNRSQWQLPGTEALEKLTDTPNWLHMFKGLRCQQEPNTCQSLPA